VDFGSQFQMLPWTIITQNGAVGADIITMDLAADTTRILATTSALMYRTGADTQTFGGFNFKYYLLQESAN
jgi:hypothetical protein